MKRCTKIIMSVLTMAVATMISAFNVFAASEGLPIMTGDGRTYLAIGVLVVVVVLIAVLLLLGKKSNKD